MINIETKGFEANRFFLKSLSEIDLISLLYETANKIIDEARSNLQNNTNIDSGTLLSSIQILEEGDDSITLGSREPYAGYIEYGRGPVKPLKEGGWLHWIDKSSGKDVFAKFANATEPSPFLEPAVIIHTNMFPDLYKKSTEEMARRKGLLNS
jgi:hypothetical protein